MGSAVSSNQRTDEEKLAFESFKNDFSSFLSSNLQHSPESRHFLTLIEVIKKFQHDYPQHKDFVSSDDIIIDGRTWYGLTQRQTVPLIEEMYYGFCKFGLSLSRS